LRAIALMLALTACAPSPSEPSDTRDDPLPTSPIYPVRTLCLAGAYLITDGGNPWFEAICRQTEGVIEDCAGDRCEALFAIADVPHTLDVLVEALDTDHSGVVDDDDAPVHLQVLAYSWGGANALRTFDLTADPRFGGSRVYFDATVTIDPYRPLEAERLEPTPSHRRVWSYRHSVTPHGDCSAQALAGPYRGIPVSCPDGRRCVDYDLSLEPGRTYPGPWGGTQTGAQLGHCTIVPAVADLALHNLATWEDAPELEPLVTSR